MTEQIKTRVLSEDSDRTGVAKGNALETHEEAESVVVDVNADRKVGDPCPGLSAEALLKRGVAQARDRDKRKGEWYPRWVGVMDAFALGSSYSKALCEWAGLNPEEMVRR